MADKVSTTAYGEAPTVANVTTSGSIAASAILLAFDDASTSVELAAQLEKAKIQMLDYLADQA